MKLFVQVKTNSKKPGVDKIDETHFVVRVTASPIDGKANAAVLKALAECLNKPISSLNIISGFKTKKKVILS